MSIFQFIPTRIRQIYFDLKLNTSEIINIVVANSIGVEVYKTQYSYGNDNQNFILDLSSFSSGVYFVRLRYDGRELFAEVVKE